MVTLSVRVGGMVKVGEAFVTVENKSGQIVRLVFDAPDDVPIQRVERKVSLPISYGISGRARRQLKNSAE